MKKILTMLLAAVLCAALLCGCRMTYGFRNGFSSFQYDDPERYAEGGASLTETVERISIQWLSGSVAVVTHDADTVAFSETANQELNGDTRMRYWLDGTTLRIQFCRSGRWNLDGLEKDLTVLLPENLLLKELEIDSVSAGIELEATDVQYLDLNTVSGGIRVRDCAVTRETNWDTISGSIRAELTETPEEISVDTVSGSVEITAPGVSCFEAGTTSGSVLLAVENAPQKVDIDTVSGGVTLCLPENADFTVDFDTVSGSFSSDLSCMSQGGRYICGNGAGTYEVDTTSGSLSIRES